MFTVNDEALMTVFANGFTAIQKYQHVLQKEVIAEMFGGVYLLADNVVDKEYPDSDLYKDALRFMTAYQNIGYVRMPEEVPFVKKESVAEKIHLKSFRWYSDATEFLEALGFEKKGNLYIKGNEVVEIEHYAGDYRIKNTMA